MWLFHLIDMGYELADKAKEIDMEALCLSTVGSLCLATLVYLAFDTAKDIIVSYMELDDEE